MTPGKVVCSIFFTRNQLLRMKELSVCSCSYLIDDCRF
jgi:hypothetical protein